MSRRQLLLSLVGGLALTAGPAFAGAVLAAAEPIVTLTAYCPCAICCGPWSRFGLTASQTVPVAGFTLASRQFPLGTVVGIGGARYQVHDRGGPESLGFDVFFATHPEARRFGVQRRRVQILHVPKPATAAPNAAPKTQERFPR